MTIQYTARSLTLGSVIPFVVLLVVGALGGPDWLVRLLLGYGVLMLAFMAGTLWMAALEHDLPRPEALIVANVLALAGWPAVIMPLAWACAWLSLCFAVHWAVEWRWAGAVLPHWYRGLRRLALLLVVVLTAAAAVLAFGRA